MGRFDYRYEVDSIYRGIADDLAEPFGQVVKWYVYDKVSSRVDDVYDVGATPDGRMWHEPRYLSCIEAIDLEGTESLNERGLYIVDRLKVTFTVQAAQEAGLSHVVTSPDSHAVDRIVFQNIVYDVDQVRVRGLLKNAYVICAADCTQVKPEQLVNDPQFRIYSR